MFTAEQWLEQFKLGSNGVRFETCWCKSDNSTLAYVRALQGHCKRTIANAKFFKNLIEIPHGWTYVIYHSSSQQYFEKIMLRGLFAGGTGREEGRQACYCSAAHSQQNKSVPDQKSWQPQIVLNVHHKWHTDTVYETDLFTAQDMGLIFLQTFSYAVVHFGDIPAECIASVVGHDQTILYERPLEVESHAPAIQADFGPSGDRLLDLDLNNKRWSISLGIVEIPCYKLLTEKS